MPLLAVVALHGPSHADSAVPVCEELLGRVRDDRRASAMTERYLSVLLAMQDRFDEGRELCARARDTLEELGCHFDLALVGLELGPLELMADRPDLAEAALRPGFEALDAMGEQNYISTVAALLAEAMCRQGRHDEAAVLAARAAEVAAPDDVITQAFLRAVQAKVASSDGEHDEARRVAHEAVELLRATDDINSQADVLYDLALVCRAAGDASGARDAAEESLALYTTKGCRPGVPGGRWRASQRVRMSPSTATSTCNVGDAGAAQLGHLGVVVRRVVVEEHDSSDTARSAEGDRVIGGGVAPRAAEGELGGGVLGVVHEHVDALGELDRGRVQRAEAVVAGPEVGRRMVGEVGHRGVPVAHAQAHGAPTLVGHFARGDGEPLHLHGDLVVGAEGPVAAQLGGADREERWRHHPIEQVFGRDALLRNQQLHPRAGPIAGGEKRQAHDVVPVKVADEQGAEEGVATHHLAEPTQPGARVEHQ
jgi:tetratricopeptide (TPR) repeat protein